MIKLAINNEVETRTLGQWFGERLPLGSVVALNGNLGAGKTTLVKGLMQSLPTPHHVQSPAFTLVGKYDATRNDQPVTVYHIDFYRLEQLSEMDRMLFAEYFDDPDAIRLVEWASKFLDEFVDDYLLIEIQTKSVDDDDSRMITVETVGDDVDLYAPLMKELKAYRV